MSFKDDIDTDLGNMLNSDEFGEVVTYSKAIGGTCSGIFDNDFVSVDIGESAPPVSDQKPTLLIRDSDLTSKAAQDDTLIIKGINYTVLDVQPDGTGATLLILEVA